MLCTSRPGNSIVLDWPTISRRHAEVRYESGRFVQIDLGSSNGTFVNSRRIGRPNMIKTG
jgi:pSer/pThr/pTyr-binding forkhead associated (FHA) protein